MGVTNHLGVILAQTCRDQTRPLLTEEENEEYASSAVARQKTRAKFEPKIGRLVYAFGRYEGLLRATIPISNRFFGLVTFDPGEKHFDSIITDRILAITKGYADHFAAMEE